MAEAVLRAHGDDLGRLRRGPGWTNATWLSDEYVVRVATKPGTADLLRERRLIALLPPEVGCPPILDGGISQGHEWVLSRRLPGENLDEVWPLLDDSARARAVRQMWQRVSYVHQVDVDAARPHVRRRSPFFPSSPAEFGADLDALVSAGALGHSEGEGLARVFDRFRAAAAQTPSALNHGDFCLPNTLWHNGSVVSLLDFEFAVIAPIAIDLNETVKMAYSPAASTEGPLLRDAVRTIAASALEAAGGPDVLIGFSVMLETWLLATELAADEPSEPDRDNATAMLRAFAAGDGGYYAPLLDAIR